MSIDFPKFSKAVHAQFASMAKLSLFKVDTLDIFDSYLNAFPEGTNPIFRERTEHDCSCCKNFIRNIGNVIGIDPEGNVSSVWDRCEDLPAPYDTVGAAMAELVRQMPIKGVYFTKERKYGAESTLELTGEGTRKWHHFYGDVPAAAYSAKPDEAAGKINTVAGVFRRGLMELTDDALETVRDLIASKSLYRGDEHSGSLEGFIQAKREWKAAPNPGNYVWANATKGVARFRNTVIGTLVTDLSNGVALEDAVRMFEAKVAPANYKRPKALVTPKMIEKAMGQLEEMGLRTAVDRRHAQLADVSVNDVLFVDRDAAPKMQDSLTEAMMGEAKKQTLNPKALLERAKPIAIADFLENVVPTAKAMEMFVDNSMTGNFASLTAPVHEDTGRLFQWDNDFAWSYVGEVADSMIAERVKAAGGSISAKLRVSLAWTNTDDLDIHCTNPQGQSINFRHKRGILDVDMNAGGRYSTSPVENLAWQNPTNGRYKISVNNYAKRNTSDQGFVIELACGGRLEQYECSDSPASGGTYSAIEFDYNDGEITNIKVGSRLTGGSASTDSWGISTMQLTPVEIMLKSPNHWNGQCKGNLHWFFILKGCNNPDPVRGIYNEFLRPELSEHRKVFELLGAKAKCPVADTQLSGIGFSSTKGQSALFVINGQQAFNVTF